jgi:hypothetical protein
VNDPGRMWHYRDFYRPPGTPAPEDLPLWLVVGNCQAEALRLTLDQVPGRPYRTARIPPVHEITDADLPHLDRLLAETAVLLVQPIRDDYRDLPLGTAQLAQRCPPGAVVLRWPVLRYAGLYPFQVIVRHPADRSVVPPGVPYHDLRTLVAAAEGRDADDPWDVEVSPAALSAVAELSRAELFRRERRDTDVGVSDVLTRHGADAAHTINHPGNPVLADLAARILANLGLRHAVEPLDHTLLGSVYAPLEQRVLDALGIDAPARTDWLVEGKPLRANDVHAVQLQWYRANPDYLTLAAQRHAAVLDLLGLSLRAAA